MSGSGPPPDDAVAAVLHAALAEDLADGPDATTRATVPAGAVVEASFVAREDGVLAGGGVALAAIDAVAAWLSGPAAPDSPVRPAAPDSPVRPAYELLDRVDDGAAIRAGQAVLRLSCPAVVLLSAERTALNLLTHLSGVATATRRWVDAVAGTGTRIRDTRKTLPGLRALEKYAVRCGGGVNHRMSLSDAVLIKDNHVAAAGSVGAAIRAVRTARPDLPLEVEVDTLAQLDEALAEGAPLVLLDNFSLADTAEAVRRVRSRHPGVRLESSGGLTLDRARAVAETGVDFLAVGALTHSALALDIGLDIGPVAGTPVGLRTGEPGRG